MKISNGLIVGAMLTVFAALAWAASEKETEEMAGILAGFPDVTADQVRPSPMAGIYEVNLGGRVAYVSADGKYLIQGDLYDVQTEENLTETRRMDARVDSLDAISESSMIVFEPDNATRTITVFTDIDCGYCRKLHKQIDDYNDQGIRVRYLFFPRSGPNTESWFKAEEVWCAENRQSALTVAKAGGAVKSEDCGITPVAEHYELGRAFGIQGTPAIVIDTGQMIPGYVAPNELKEYLDE